ncbi:MAG TPA: PASTA domain-containing protein [Solirubrobacteraceae bacterium]|nr:PASTA domain-containing protein [Solirubrobacteraceae bacterium]
MTICPSCGRENEASRDFCECGEYLRWEPTQFVRTLGSAHRTHDTAPLPVERDATLAPGVHVVVSPQPVRAPGGVRPPRGGGRAALLLRLSDDEAAAAGPVSLRVTPGERAVVLGLVRNESDIVDSYEISVRGLPEGWWTVTPPIAYLVPYGTSGTYEQEVQINLHPPRTPAAQARPWALEVVARSRAHAAELASAPVTLAIARYEDVGAKLAPDRASGRLKARFVLTVRNRANARAEVQLDALDADGECQFRFATPSVTIEPGQGVEAPLTVFPPRQIWLGRPQDRPVLVSAIPAGAAESPVQVRAVYRQRAWLPWWLAVVAPIVAAVAAALILLAPKQTVVPNLTQAQNVFDAQKLADKAGVTLSPQVDLVQNASAKPGSIVDQSPGPGTHVKRGTIVSIQVAKGSGTVKVPSVAGLTAVTADQALRAAGLQLGAVSPQPPAPNAPIASQIPAPQVAVAPGTPVQVFLAPKLAGKAKAAGAGTGAGTGAGRGAGTAAGKPVVIPALSGDLRTAAQRLSQLGLIPTSAKRIAPSPGGALVGTEPAAGATVPAGSQVKLLVSAGFPALAYDDRATVRVVDPVSGRLRVAAPPSLQPQQEGTWSPDGSDVVFSQGGQLVIWATGRPGSQPAALTPSGSDDHDPAFAPSARVSVLAFIDEHGGGGRLCFAALGPNQLNPDCTGYPGFALTHQISWSPDGRAVLVAGVKNGSGGSVFGLIEFTSNEPFTTDARAWGQGRLVTDTSRVGHGILAGAFSPDGKQVALVSNIGTGGFYLFLAPRGDFALAPPAQATASPACQVSWRPDGHELAVMQADLLCKESSGAILTLDPTQLNLEHRVATQAADPAWQPLASGG